MKAVSYTRGDHKVGVRDVSAIVSATAASTPVTLYNLGTNQSCRIRKIMTYNGATNANTRIQIGTGTGAGYAQKLNDIYIVIGQSDVLTEDQICGFEFFASPTFQAIAAGAGTAAVQVQVEVEVYSGKSG